MANKYTLQKVYGKSLTKQTLSKIVKIWAKEFQKGRTEVYKDCVFDEDLFFILRNNHNKLLAFGSLKQIQISFLKKSYLIHGIKGIVALSKRRGYGRIIMQEIYKHCMKECAISIGFCKADISPFYEKCNFLVKKNYVKKFVLKDTKKRNQKTTVTDVDVIYFEGKGDLMKKILSSPKAKVYIPYFW